jgi:hypothetical protein
MRKRRSAWRRSEKFRAVPERAPLGLVDDPDEQLPAPVLDALFDVLEASPRVHLDPLANDQRAGVDALVDRVDRDDEPLAPLHLDEVRAQAATGRKPPGVRVERDESRDGEDARADDRVGAEGPAPQGPDGQDP